MKKIIILSSDTLHHRYFINALIKNGIDITACILETVPVEPAPFFDKEEEDFERKNFFKDVPRELKIKVFQARNINDDAARGFMSEINPDLGIVFGTGKILPGVLFLFKDGLINVHRGIAQKYRGLDSCLWALYQNDCGNIGVTIHKVDSKLDTGDIVYQKTLDAKLLKDMEIYQIRYYTTKIAVELVLKALDDYRKGGIKSTPQQAKGTYYSFMPLELKKISAVNFERYKKSRHE